MNSLALENLEQLAKPAHVPTQVKKRLEWGTVSCSLAVQR
jgi:hypothetical protein